MNQAISRWEWRRVALFAALVLLLVSAPYWLGWGRSGGEGTFSGFLFGVEDGNSYIAKMRLGAQGRWDFSLFYTAEAHEGAGLLFLPYIVPGQIVSLFMRDTDPALTGTLIGVFHLMRVVFGGLLMVVIYRFIAFFISEGWLRMLALVLATLGGGFGWLLTLTGAGNPPEFFIPEGFTLQILLGLPHLALARSVLLGGLLAMIFSLGHERWWPRALLAGALWLIVGLSVPFYLVIIYAILGVWGLAAWVRARVFPWALFVRALLAGGVTLPLFAYNVVVFTGNPAFAQWSAQNILTSPPLLHSLLSYLPLGVLAILGGRWLWRRAELPHMLLIGWPVIVPLLVYLPINVQRRLAEAVIVPLAILAVMGVALLAERFSRNMVIALTLLATLPTGLFLVFGGYVTALSSSPPVAISIQQIAAFDWLNAHAESGNVVFSTHASGNPIPAYTNLRVYIGHGPETLDAITKARIAERFYADELSDSERADLFESMHIRYVFYGPNERAVAGDSLNWQDGLTQVYTSGDVALYEVTDSE